MQVRTEIAVKKQIRGGRGGNGLLKFQKKFLEELGLTHIFFNWNNSRLLGTNSDGPQITPNITTLFLTIII